MFNCYFKLLKRSSCNLVSYILFIAVDLDVCCRLCLVVKYMLLLVTTYKERWRSMSRRYFEREKKKPGQMH